ncbi:hypothetical protein [Microbulbifer sp. JMSA003]|uniref:hypothetical protein n=1 Tax=Microbulbifer sp. JMSA003 TaxID=3243369 RepID=UPI0040391459
MEEFDSIPEIIFWTTNVGVIALGILFFFIIRNRVAKLSLVILMLGFHFIVVPSALLGCEIAVFDEVFCRESGWLLVFIPPAQFLVGVVALVAVKIICRANAGT